MLRGSSLVVQEVQNREDWVKLLDWKSGMSVACMWHGKTLYFVNMYY
jgi:hypothetical protein